MPQPSQPTDDPGDLIACPSCDALYRVAAPQHGERAVCARCHHVLVTPIEGAIVNIVALSLTVLMLLVTAIFMPFLKIEANGLSHTASILDAALSFADAKMMGLSFAVLSLIVFIPVLRALLLLFTLVPLLLQGRPLPGARLAFRWSEDLRPWSMAEIFVLGVGVALVKLADMARVELGAAFWLFAALVVVTAWQDMIICRWSIWTALDDGRAAPSTEFERGQEPDHG